MNSLNETFEVLALPQLKSTKRSGKVFRLELTRNPLKRAIGMVKNKISKSETGEYRPTLSHLATLELRRSLLLQFDSLGYLHTHTHTHTYIHAHNQDRSHKRVINILVKCCKLYSSFSRV